MGLPEGMDWRLLVPWIGVVTNIEDPLGLHRVRARIPGVMDETAWAKPTTIGGGSAQAGGHIVPPVGSDVKIEFMGAEEEYPIYTAGHWGTGEPPQSIVDAGTDAHLVQALQLGVLLFTYDGRPRSEDGRGQLFTITDTKAGTVIMTYDIELQGWDIQADYMIRLKSTGLLVLDGLITQMSGRALKRGTQSKI